jgi:AAA+ lid domain
MKHIETIVREQCEGYSGADLAALVRHVGVIALRKTLGLLDEMDECIDKDYHCSSSPRDTPAAISSVKSIDVGSHHSRERVFDYLHHQD